MEKLKGKKSHLVFGFYKQLYEQVLCKKQSVYGKLIAMECCGIL